MIHGNNFWAIIIILTQQNSQSNAIPTLICLNNDMHLDYTDMFAWQWFSAMQILISYLPNPVMWTMLSNILLTQPYVFSGPPLCSIISMVQQVSSLQVSIYKAENESHEKCYEWCGFSSFDQEWKYAGPVNGKTIIRISTISPL